MKNLAYYAKNLFEAEGPWIKKLQGKGYNVTAKTLQTKNMIAKNYVVPLWGHLKPDKITIKIIDDALLKVKSYRNEKDLAFGTKNRILFVLSSIFVYLFEEGVVKSNPARNVRPFTTVPQNPRGILFKDELDRLFPETHEALLDIWKHQIFVCAFLIMRDTGLRNGELLALRWGDWYNDIMCFPITKAIEAGTVNIIKGPKTGRSRVALVKKQTAIEIEIYKKQKQSLPEQYIFSNRDGGPIQGHRLTSAFHNGVRRANIQRTNITPYWLRHTFITSSLETNPFDIVRRLVGHMDISTTLDYRNNNVESLLREAVMMRGILDGKANELQLLQKRLIGSQLDRVEQKKKRVIKRAQKVKIIQIENYEQLILE
jgi:integrase